jgi:hypothetical protein
VSFTQVKSSECRKVKKSITDEYPSLDDLIDEIFPKKAPLFIAKW